MKNRKKVILTILLGLVFSNIMAISDLDTDKALIFSIAGRERTYILKVPDNYNSEKQYSLMFFLHGAGATASDVKDRGFTEKGNDLDFIVVYPNSIRGRWTLFANENETNPDMDFLSNLIDILDEQYNIDLNRVYVAGRSLGGFMAHRLAEEMPEKFAAVSAISGSVIPVEKIKHPTEIPVQQIHALDDNVISYFGIPGQMLSANGSIDYWNKINNITDKPIIFYNNDRIIAKRWQTKNSETVTELITHETGGHGNLPLTTEFVLDFFYNNPPRGNRVSIDLDSSDRLIDVNSEIDVNITIESTKSVKNIVYKINDVEVYTATKPPFSLKWTPNKKGEYNISAYANLKNGEKVISSTTLSLLALTPYLKGNYNTVTSSEESNQNVSSYIVDNNIKTRWSSKWEDNEAIVIDLNEIKTISALTILWETAFGKKYIIGLSPDGIKWKHIPIESSKPEVKFIDFIPTETRYIRLTGVERGTKWGYSIWEMFIHN